MTDEHLLQEKLDRAIGASPPYACPDLDQSEPDPDEASGLAGSRRVWGKELVATRGKTHGDFSTKAAFIQSVKLEMRALNWGALTYAQQEALDNIVAKIGRILTGNPDEADHWADIGGYAQLACGD